MSPHWNSLCFQQNESKTIWGGGGAGGLFDLKTPRPLIHRSCLLLWSFLSLRADRVLAKFGFRRPSETILCPGCVLSVWWLSPGLNFLGRTKLLKSKAEWIIVSSPGRDLWEECVWVCAEWVWVWVGVGRFGFA